MKDRNLVLFGERIKELRKVLGLSQKDFARRIKIPNSSLSEFESGVTKPTFYFFFNISKVFDVNLRYLFFGEGEIFTKKNGVNGNKDLVKDEEIKEMVYYMQIPAIRLSILAEYNKLKKIFAPMIDDFNKKKNDIKEETG